MQSQLFFCEFRTQLLNITDKCFVLKWGIFRFSEFIRTVIHRLDQAHNLLMLKWHMWHLRLQKCLLVSDTRNVFFGDSKVNIYCGWCILSVCHVSHKKVIANQRHRTASWLGGSLGIATPLLRKVIGHSGIHIHTRSYEILPQILYLVSSNASCRHCLLWGPYDVYFGLVRRQRCPILSHDSAPGKQQISLCVILCQKVRVFQKRFTPPPTPPPWDFVCYHTPVRPRTSHFLGLWILFV